MKYDQPMEHGGEKGFFIQGSCVFYSAENVKEAIAKYRTDVANNNMLLQSNEQCDHFSAILLDD